MKQEKYQQAFNILMDYYNEFSDESKKEIDSQLKAIGM